jgi:hypothetical protein
MITKFYVEVLNLEVLGNFVDHDSYNGVFIGKKGQPWHLEYTTSHEPTQHSPDEDDILVFYPKTATAYDAIISNIHKLGIAILASKNPYWNKNGVMIKDPDGFNVIVTN